MTKEKKFDFDNPNSKYKPEYDELVYEHLKNGYTISSFNIKESPVRQKTIFHWLENIEEFAMAAERGRIDRLLKLETALNIKMYGTKISEKQKEVFGKIDTELLKFTLSKLYRKEYSEKVDHEHSGEVVTKINFIEMPGRQPKKEKNDNESL